MTITLENFSHITKEANTLSNSLLSLQQRYELIADKEQIEACIDALDILKNILENIPRNN